MGGPGHIHGHTGQKYNLPSRDTQVPHARGALGAVKAISQGGPSSPGRGLGCGISLPV